MDCFHLAETKQDLLKMSNLGLAYLGDAVYEVMVRAWLCLQGKLTPGALHRSALDYVSAPRQAAMMERLLPVLTEEERTIFRRGRNSSPHSHARGPPAGVSDRHGPGGPVRLALSPGGHRPVKRTV